MELGLVVKSKVGHDSGSFYVIVKIDERGFYIADGRRRKLLKPKVKNIKHLSKTNTIVDLDEIDTDKKLRRVLWEFNFPHSPVAE